MKRRSIASILILMICAMLFAGCGGRSDSKDSGKAEESKEENVNEDTKEDDASDDDEKADDTSAEDSEKDEKEKSSDKPSLAQRMAGKYSYDYSDQEGNEEFYTMEVVPFGSNLCAFCGQAMPDDYESFEAYTFWAAEFIPDDADEMASTDGDTVTVSELRFSVMSNAGLYWDAGQKGTITLTDDGLVFEGFDNDTFLVPEDDDSRLFLKDDRVEDTFDYLKNDPDGGDDDLQGYWMLDDSEENLYLEFSGSDLYMYKKAPDSEVYYLAGGCDHSDGSFECTASRLGYGGEPVGFTCDYVVKDDTLNLKFKDSDLPGDIPAKGKYIRIDPEDVHVTTVDEVEFDSESFGMYGGGQDLEELTSGDYYGVFVSSSKDPDKCTPVIEKLEEADFYGSSIIYTPDFDGLNPEPYYVVAAGLYTSESDAKELLSDLKAAGFADAYVKHAGSYTGEKYWYTMHDGSQVEVLKDGAMLRGVSVSIPCQTDGAAITADLFVPKDAVFGESAETEFFGNYEKGDTPYDWIVRNYNMMNEDPDQYLMYGPALSGVFEVSLDGNNVTAYYGSYWWD